MILFIDNGDISSIFYSLIIFSLCVVEKMVTFFEIVFDGGVKVWKLVFVTFLGVNTLNF